MNKDFKESHSGSPVIPSIEPHYSARPMKVVRDKYGRLWICDQDVEEEDDLEAQGAWRCGDLTFTCIG
jgi:hypothetical protein